MQLHTYLNFNGNCRAAFAYYEKHLGGKTTMMMTHADAPFPPPAPEWGPMIMHARMDLGDTELLAADVPPERHQPMRSAYLSLSLDGAQEAERVFAALSDGGEVFMPMQETFFAERFAMLRDQFGTLWMVIAEKPRQ